MNRPIARELSAMRALFAFALLAAVQISATATAATINITPVYVQSFAEGLVPLGALPNDGAATPVGGMLHYEFRLSVDELMAGEDFWTAIFDVNLGPGLEAVTTWMDPGTAQANEFYALSPSLATYDSNGAALGGVQQHWQYGNGDFGLDPDDLQSIIVEAAPSEAANRQYGELFRPGAGNPDALGSPTLIGAILVRRTELVASSVSVSPIGGSPWGTYTDNALGQGDLVAQPGTSFRGETAMLPVPEPSSVALCIAAAATLLVPLRRRRRRFNPAS
jgi:hypothetical protein